MKISQHAHKLHIIYHGMKFVVYYKTLSEAVILIDLNNKMNYNTNYNGGRNRKDSFEKYYLNPFSLKSRSPLGYPFGGDFTCKTIFMIIGLGTDIVEIASIQKAMEQSNRFAKRVFTENEIRYCESKPLKYQHYAARFAAKEAVMKALKTGWDKGVQWEQVEIFNQPSGTPIFLPNGKTKELLDKIGATNIEVSLSHSEQYAIAVVCIFND